ncbi:MAG TPA: hypothetical protein VM511_01395, partial [Luteolibacter sp.]|nr:hypothetical protein [Luteolibacter sp.]
MDKAQTRLSGSLFAIWLVMSFIVCIIVATVINVMIPYHFESTVVVASDERFNGEQMISPAQAKLIERELELARRGFGWEKIRSAVRVRKVSQGTEITVRTQDIYTSY